MAPITITNNSLAGWIFNPHGSVQYTLLSLTDAPKQTINLSDFKITQMTNFKFDYQLQNRKHMFNIATVSMHLQELPKTYNIGVIMAIIMAW